MTLSVQQLDRVLQQVYGGVAHGVLTALKGDASSRRYYRFALSLAAEAEASPGPAPGAPASLVVMRLPDAADAAAAGMAQAEAFLDVGAFLSAQGIRVPRVLASDLSAGLILLEDLGDETFEARLRKHDPSRWPALYGAAIDLLAQLHEKCAPPKAAESCIAYRKRFDAALLRWELDHFRQWGLEALFGELPSTARAELDGAFDALTAELCLLPEGFVHRDYQSRNLMWSPQGELVLIDFQDAFLGPAPYDLVALLSDSYVALSTDLQVQMLEQYALRRRLTAAASSELRRGFLLITVQRKLKDAGRFVFIDRVRGNPGFLQYYPQSLRYVARALCELPEYAHLRALLETHVPGFPAEVAVPAALTAT